MCHLLCRASMINRSSRITTADDCYCTLFRALYQDCDNGISAPGEGRHLCDAEGAVPDNGFCICKRFTEYSYRPGTNIHNAPSLRNLVNGYGFVGSIAGKLVGDYYIARQQQFEAMLASFCDQFTGYFELLVFNKRISCCISLGLEKGVCHAAT